MRLEKRLQTSRLALVLAPLGAVACTLLVSTLLVLWAGAPVGQTYALLLQGGLGSVFAISETLTRAIPLMLTGLAATVAFKAKLFNIGAEGQLYVGALAAVAVGGMHGGLGWDLAPALLFVLMMLAAALAGALLLLTFAPPSFTSFGASASTSALLIEPPARPGRRWARCKASVA